MALFLVGVWFGMGLSRLHGLGCGGGSSNGARLSGGSRGRSGDLPYSEQHRRGYIGFVNFDIYVWSMSLVRFKQTLLIKKSSVKTLLVFDFSESEFPPQVWLLTLVIELPILVRHFACQPD